MNQFTAVLQIPDNRLAESIREHIINFDSFTNVVNTDPRDVATKALGLLCLNSYSTDGNITHLCIIKKQGRVATGQIRVKGTHFIEIEPLEISLLISALEPAFRNRADAYFNAAYHKLPPRLGEELYHALVKLRPAISDKLQEVSDLLHHRNHAKISSREIDAAAEKDALGLSLDIFGIDRNEILNSWNRSSGTLGQSFLSGLNEYVAYEDDIISYDLHTFPGFEVLKDNVVTGVVEFESADGEKLTVINANRKPLEKAMGVDLIYFHRKYESFVMVQYKMMDQRNEEQKSLYYNPNQDSHHNELKRLQNLKSQIDLEEKGVGLNIYRFSNSAIFFKLCKKIEVKKEDNSLAPGMYIPLEHWELLINDESTKGKNGGVQLGYHTLKKRYLSKDTFVDLVQAGMIGTADKASAKIGLFIQAAIEMGHTVMYAIDDRKGNRSSRKQNVRKKTLADELFGADDDYSEEDEPPF